MEHDRTELDGICQVNPPDVKPMGRSAISNGARLLNGIDGRSLIARRLRDILRQLLVEFPVRTPVDELLIRQAATLSVLNEKLQSQIVNGESVDVRTVTNLSGQLRRILSDLRTRNGHRGPPPPSTHEHLASYHERLDPDDDEDGDQ